jgi:hypothetical protein
MTLKKYICLGVEVISFLDPYVIKLKENAIHPYSQSECWSIFCKIFKKINCPSLRMIQLKATQFFPRFRKSMSNYKAKLCIKS